MGGREGVNSSENQGATNVLTKFEPNISSGSGEKVDLRGMAGWGDEFFDKLTKNPNLKKKNFLFGWEGWKGRSEFF